VVTNGAKAAKFIKVKQKLRNKPGRFMLLGIKINKNKRRIYGKKNEISKIKENSQEISNAYENGKKENEEYVLKIKKTNSKKERKVKWQIQMKQK